jgi:Cu/Ag efflux pump CusA
VPSPINIRSFFKINGNIGKRIFSNRTQHSLVEGRIKTLEDVASIVVGNNNGVPILVSDVARVEIGALTRYGAVVKIQ